MLRENGLFPKKTRHFATAELIVGKWVIGSGTNAKIFVAEMIQRWPPGSPIRTYRSFDFNLAYPDSLEEILKLVKER